MYNCFVKKKGRRIDMKTRKIVASALLAALVCVATMIIKIPSPLKGYINLGDSAVLLSGWVLSPWYGFFAAAIGSALADVFSGYVMYAPATFVIKGIVALLACVIYKALLKKSGSLASRIISGVIAEVVMVLGYLAFESVLYGFVPSLVNVPANAVQGVAGIIVGILLVKIFEKNKIFMQ